MSGGATPAVRTVRGTLNADQIVVATGAWARELLPWVPVVPSRGHMIAFEAPHLRARHIIHIPGGSLVQRSDGRVLYGATKERAGFDRRLRAGAVQEMLNGALATLPAWRIAPCPQSGPASGPNPRTASPSSAATRAAVSCSPPATTPTASP